MISQTRPNPDELLKYVERAESRRSRGELKIFLGYAAGVGKTYAMLEAAQQRRVEGADIVVAYVETHGRPETEALLEELDVIPRAQIEYRGVILEDMDLDAVLARRPQIAVVDELAHTNAPGSRHLKRYQDVLELLNAGIDVYTTLNVQHVESLNDVVAQITGVSVRETVPDRLLDEADDIELIDLPTDELRQRLDEGKVYVPAQAEEAMRKFFRPGNLTALRELALRRTAERVDEEMRAYMQTHAIPGPWPASERILVCVSPSPLSERLVRSTRRLATRLDAEWFAVYVETPGHMSDLVEEERDRVSRTLRLAEELGAKSVTLSGQSVADTIVSYAQKHNITKIVAGKPLRSRWVELLRGSPIDQIIRRSGDIDVHVISSAPTTDTETPRPAPHEPEQSRAWGQYAQSIGLVLAVTVLGLPLRPLIEPTNLVMLYLLAVVVAGVQFGRNFAVLVSILSVAAFDFVFVPPYYTYVVADAEYIFTFAGLLTVGLVISTLAARAREQARAAQRREAQTTALYELTRDLVASRELHEIAQTALSHVDGLLEGDAVILLPDSDESLSVHASNDAFQIDDNEFSVARWVYEHGEPAGRGTTTLVGSDGYYLPLKAGAEAFGVLGIHFGGEQRTLSPDQRRLLESFASQTALAIERVHLAETAQQAQLLQETERLQTALLNSISHDLRTPLASITGALNSLSNDDVLDEESKHELLDMAREEAGRLNTFVSNLLDMTRLEAGTMKISAEPCDMQDAIGVALSQLDKRLKDTTVTVDIPDDLPLVTIDFILIVQVLVNLLDNAIKYSPEDARIQVRAHISENEMIVDVIDNGVGIPEPELSRVFDKFYRVSERHSASGTGLGLSISKGIVEAHGGRIWVQNRTDENGAVVSIALPLEQT